MFVSLFACYHQFHTLSNLAISTMMHAWEPDALDYRMTFPKNFLVALWLKVYPRMPVPILVCLVKNIINFAKWLYDYLHTHFRYKLI